MPGNRNSGRRGKSAGRKAPELELIHDYFTAKMPSRVRKNTSARNFWKGITEEMRGKLTNKDSYGLEVMSMLYAETMKLSDYLLTNGYTAEYVSNRGQTNMSKRPEVDILKNTRQELTKMMVQFGLTPRAGNQVKAIPKVAGVNQQEDDGLGDYE